MWCARCRHDLSDCTCPDIDQRLQDLAKEGKFVYRMCGICGRHYDRCRCPDPLWGRSDEVFQGQEEK